MCEKADETFEIKNLHPPLREGDKIKITEHYTVSWYDKKPTDGVGPTYISWREGVDALEQSIATDQRMKNHEILKPKKQCQHCGQRRSAWTYKTIERSIKYVKINK